MGGMRPLPGGGWRRAAAVVGGQRRSVRRRRRAVWRAGGGPRLFRQFDRRGRPKGLKNKIRPEIRRMLGEATLMMLMHVLKRKLLMVHLLTLWLQAISVLTEVVMFNPCLPDMYHTLGLVYDTIGNAEKAAASVFMETNAYDKALQHIGHSHLVYYSGEELPLNLKIRAGICHIHLVNMEKSEVC
ncbi:hypothetical protein Q3G72_028948 [Acer saccharum]|nr:hypothetical protein Q3G72_028948 [Acer saccharum]